MAAFPWSAVIGAAGSAASAFFGKPREYSFSDWKKQADYSHAQNKEMAQNAIRWRAADAREAGIHPLAALGGGVSFGSAQPVPTSSGSSGGSGAGDAVGAGLAELGRQLATQRSALENEKLRADIQQSRSVADWYEARSRTLLAGGRAAAVGATTGQISPPGKLMGMDISPNPNTSDAEWFQRRYGEAGEWISSPFVAAADIERNTGMPATWRMMDYGRRALEYFWED